MESLDTVNTFRSKFGERTVGLPINTIANISKVVDALCRKSRTISLPTRKSWVPYTVSKFAVYEDKVAGVDVSNSSAVRSPDLCVRAV